MAGTLQLTGWPRHAALVYCVHLSCWTSMLRSTPVKSKYPLTSITWSYRLKFRAHRGHVFFWSWPLTKCWFSIGSRVHVRLTCCKRGQVVRQPVNATPRLKVNRNINISCIQMSWTASVLCILRLFKVKTEGQTRYGKPHCKVTKLKSNFLLNLAYLNRVLNIAAQELRF